MEIPRHWRLKKQRYGLIGKICSECDVRIFPPRDVCPECGVGGVIEFVNVTADFARAKKKSAPVIVR